MASFALASYEKAMAKHTAVLKKQEDIQRQIELAQGSMVRDIESNKTILYYRSELLRIENDTEKKLSYYRSEMARVEAKAEADKTRYTDLMNGKIQQIESAEPDTPAYRKMKVEKSMLEKEEEKTHTEMLEALQVWTAAQDRASKSKIQEEERKNADFLRAQEEKVTEARRQEAIRLERECEEKGKKMEESLKKAGGLRKEVVQGPVDHVKFTLDSLETAFPQPKIKPTRKGKKLNIENLKKGEVYYTEDLKTIDTDNLTDEQFELFDDLWTSACKLEGIVGCRKVDK
jgi:hypothetical protein